MKTLTTRTPTARRITREIINSRILRRLAEIKLASRLTTLLMLTALLLPLVFFGQSPRTSAQSISPIFNSLPPAPVAAPPEAFAAISSEPGFPSAMASVVSLSFGAASDKLASGYESAANFIAPPAPPEGFGNAKMPTFGDRVAESFSSLTKKKSAADTAETRIETNIEPSAPVAPVSVCITSNPKAFDFDGDGCADVARFQPSSNQWKIKNSNGGSITTSTLGTSGSLIAPADYDGDGKTDRAVFNQNTGNWTIKISPDGATQTISAFGLNGDKPVSGDYDGDGKADAALWRPSSGTWYVRRSSDGQFTSTVWGQSGDIPVPGNYDGSGGLDLAVFRPSNGTWYVLLPGNGGSYTYFQWGANGDVPVPASYDNDSKTDYAVFRPANGTWYVNRSDGGSYIGKTWGNYGDQPVPADYDGDGKADFAVWRPTSGVWYLVKSSDATLNTYAYDQLGIPGDVAVPSAYVKQIGGQVLSYDLANARLAPKNATGGTDLYSRNFSWGTGLVSLPGRAGLDAGFGISYNSLVWIKEPTSNTMVFDADHSNVSPGFRFGFPTIEPSYYNGLTQQFSYLMVTPSGARVEFRQNAASGVYETADSSYAQLTVFKPRAINGQPPSTAEDATLTITTTDGTQMTYVWRAGAYRLSEIKDRNGNFITVVYDSDYGLLRSMTDTLGRIVTVEYDGDFYPTAIKQNWQTNNGAGATVSHTYATFTYTAKQIAPNFASGINVFGPSGGAYIKVLQQITYPNGGSTTFNYNDYGQVYKVRNVAADSSAHELNSARTDLETPAANQTDCPRFSTTYNKVENFNNGAETTIHNTFSSNQTYAAGGESLAPTDMTEVWMDGDPHVVHSKTYYYQAGNWAEGLPLGTEDIADGTRKRWTRTVWTQDDTTKIYKVNPRAIESKVGDTTNVKKTVVGYRTLPQDSAVAEFGLVNKIELYNGNTGTLLKRTTTDYNLDAAYVSRRIIGLPSQTESYGLNDSTNQLEFVSKMAYGYDDEDGFGGLEQNISSVIRHDNTNYGADFIAGRGNLTSTIRHDVLTAATVTAQTKHNTAGAVVKQITSGSTSGTTREVKISYADVFNDTTSTRNTYAYPTKLTDPANNFSQVKYRFDIGANVWAKSPDLNATTAGKQTSRNYDGFGRLERESILNSGAYTRYEYPTSGTQSKVYSTIVDTNDNGADTADEVLAESWTDGAGRTLASRTILPGSTGGYSGSLAEYDILGQVKRTSVPTEINGNWTPAGDDATRGWLWTSQEYDWKGRITRTVNTDGTDTLASYDGCGCAGGQITTIQSELVPRDDQPTTMARRTQKAYADVLGRNYKTEVLDWNGAVYKTNLEIYNGRDQVITSREIAGNQTSNNLQETALTYDGIGRLKTRHTPQQGVNTSTIYNYNDDDSVSSVIDARGAGTTYTYNSRKLLTKVDYAMVTPQNINNLTPIIHGLDNGGSSNRFHIIIKGNNFGTNPQVILDLSGGAAGGGPTESYEGNQLQRWETGGDEYVAFDLQSYQAQHSLITSPGIYVSVKNRPSGKSSSKPLISVGLANSVYRTRETTRVDLIASTSVIPEVVLQTPSVIYEYDNAGNRIKMTDGMGEQLYEYDQLSHLKSETRNFNETPPSQITPPNGFKIQYEYGLGNQLKKITDPYGEEVKYSQDKIGRLTTVSGFQSATQSNLQYVTESNYFAFGGIKKTAFGNNTFIQNDYNDRLQPRKTSLGNVTTGSSSEFEYQYYADGKSKFSKEQGTFLGKEGGDLSAFDRSYEYDFAGRMTTAKTGAEARGQTETDAAKRPYRINYTWDSFDHLLKADKLHWTQSYPQEATSFINNREPIVNIPPSPYPPHWSDIISPIYDSDGRKLGTNRVSTSDFSTGVEDFWDATFDMAGRRARDAGEKHYFDGDGHNLKSTSETIPYQIIGQGRMEKQSENTYLVYSSVLGETINKISLKSYDTWFVFDFNPPYDHYEYASKITNIYANGTKIAQNTDGVTQTNVEDAWGTFYQEKTLAVNNGQPNPTQYIATNSMELDPFRTSVGEKNPYSEEGGDPHYDDGNGCGGIGWQDGEHYEEPPCDDAEDDPTSDEDAQIGSLPENICYINGFEAKCNEAANHPDLYEEAPPDVVTVQYTNGSYGLALYNQNLSGYFVGSNGSASSGKPRTPPTLKRPTKAETAANKERARRSPLDGRQESQSGGDPFSFIIWAKDLSENLTTNTIVDSTVLDTGVGGEMEADSILNRIRNQVRRLVTDNNCRKAFIDNGFGDPRKILYNSVENKAAGDSNAFSWTILSAFALNNTNVASQLGLSEESRQNLLSRSAPASTDAGYGVTVFRNSALSDQRSLEYHVTHEFFHALGYPGQTYLGGVEGLVGVHDLTYLKEKGYDAIIAACTK